MDYERTGEIDCHTCGRVEDGDACPLQKEKINVCLSTSSRPYWIPKTKEETPCEHDPKSRYYGVGGIETLEVIRAKLTQEQFHGFCLGNAIKYLCRANHKADYPRDIEKAEFYTKEIQR